MEYLYLIFPIMFSLFPLVVTVLLFFALERFIFAPAIKIPTRSYEFHLWYLTIVAVLALKFIGRYLPANPLPVWLDQTAGWLFFGAVPLSLGVVAIGFWQPLWSATSNKYSGYLKLFPALFVITSLLGVPAVWICMFVWPFGFFVIAPATTIGLIAILSMSFKGKGSFSTPVDLENTKPEDGGKAT